MCSESRWCEGLGQRTQRVTSLDPAVVARVGRVSRLRRTVAERRAREHEHTTDAFRWSFVVGTACGQVQR